MMDIHEYLVMLSDECIDGDGDPFVERAEMQHTIGDYIFKTGKDTGLGDIEVNVTDYLGTDCGNFYTDVNDTEEDFQAMCEAWVKEAESPSYT